MTILLSGELAESVSEVIHRYAPGSVIIDQFDSPGDAVRLRSYLPMDDQYETKLQSIEVGLGHLSQINPIPTPSYSTIEEQPWSERWKEHFHPLLIGDRLIILPTWYSTTQSTRLPILIEPGMAFGTGTHPTTQLCLQALEWYVRDGSRVVDLGCGSGILSIAAVRLGASKVQALDIDPDAVKLARVNVAHNQLEQAIEVLQGSLDILLEREQDSNPPADILVANILTKVLDRMLSDDLARCIRQEGILILSGILSDQVDGLLETCMKADLHLLEVRQMGDWSALCLRKKLPS
jgi:ribosomal protein L11 methyltransferase